MNDLLSATAAAEQIRSSEAQALHENELFEKASAEYDQAQAVGEDAAPDEQVLMDLSDRADAEFSHHEQIAIAEATPSPSPDEIKARGDMPASVLVRESWNAFAGGGKHVLDATGYVVAGLFDAVKELGNTMVSVDDELKKAGIDYAADEQRAFLTSIKGGRVVGPDEPITMIGGMGQLIQKGTTALEPWVADTWESDNAVRKVTQALSGFIVTKRVSAATGLTKGLVSLGRSAVNGVTNPKALQAAQWAGKAGLNSLQAGVAQAWSMGADETIIDALVSLGVPRNETMAYLDSSEDNTEFENRVKNGITTAMASAALEPVVDFAVAPVLVKTLKSMKKVRTLLKGAADKAEEVGDPTLADTIRATQERNRIVQEQLVGILGDSSMPLYVKEGARGALGTDPLAPIRAAGVTAEEAMDSVLTRATKPGAAPEPLYNRINYARIDSPDDIMRAASDFQEGFAREIGSAVGPKRTFDAVKADAKELDGWALVANSVKTGEHLQDAEMLAVRDFYILTLRKFMDVARLHQATPTDATRAAGAKLMEIVRETQRIVRRESAQASRNLGALRIPASQAEGYALHKQLNELMPELDASDVDTVLKAVSKASAKGRPDAAANIMLNMDGIKATGRAVSKQVKNYYYFSMLSRFTTHVRNAIGSPAFFALKMIEMKAAQKLHPLVDSVFGDVGEGVYDGEVSAHVAGFMKGMGEALRLPELVDSLDEGVEAVMSRDRGAISGAVSKFSDAFDGGVYKAFGQNKSRFGGSQISDSSTTGPLMGTTPTHLWGYSTEENVGRALNLLHSVTVRPYRAVISTPGRALNAMDELFKTANQRAEIRGTAYRMAMSEVRSGKLPADQLTARVEALAANPNTSMMIAGDMAAQAGTFTSRPTPGSLASTLEKFHNTPILGPIFVPFSRAPGNIAWEGVRRTPLGILPSVDSFLSDVSSSNARTRDLAWSRMILGNMAIVGALDFFMDGDRVQIVGADDSEGGPAGRQTRHRSFMDPLNLRISTNPDGGFDHGEFVTVPIRGYDPVTFPIVIAANILQHAEQGVMSEKEFSTTDLMAAYGSAVASVLIDQSSMSSLRDGFTALGEDRFGDFLIRQVGSAITPGATEQFVPFTDDVYRETFSLMDTVRASTPGLSDSLPANRDAWGFTKKRLPGWSGVFQSMAPRHINADLEIQPVDRWLIQKGHFVGEPSKETAAFRNGVNVPWHRYPEAYEEYKRLSGHGLVAPERDRDVLVQTSRGTGNIVSPPGMWTSVTEGGLVEELNLLVQGKHNRGSGKSPTQVHFDMLPDDDARAQYIAQAVNFYRAAAREKLLLDPRFADLATEVTLKKTEAAAVERDPKRKQRLSFGFGTKLRGSD